MTFETVTNRFIVKFYMGYTTFQIAFQPISLKNFRQKTNITQFHSVLFTIYPDYGEQLPWTFLDLNLAIFSMATQFILLFAPEIAEFFK
jgi:hypothetical protein